MYAHRAIVIDALAVLRNCGLAEGHAGPPRGVESRDEQAQAEAVGQAIDAIERQRWDEFTHAQRQILLVAQATIRHYPQHGASLTRRVHERHH
ncbi:hypothetical protein [Sinomonas humi]|uniref:Uncharacterized protein n=1 Tax=Sinomonas humi TaxID=1338436 RepID=A0A0B2AB54_9MICC|nr:hypothetical protein [Sinomonas humi]KHL00345.1 hypothetical protein LK10_20585 [Sinomonas humi]